MSVTDNFKMILEKVAKAAERSGRDPSSVRIMGASKGQSIQTVSEAIGAGLSLIGENYVQEAERKIEGIRNASLEAAEGIEWHLIGSLQKNKAKTALSLFDVIESVDRIGLAKELDNKSIAANKKARVFVEVNIGMEESKSGISVAKLNEFLLQLKDLKSLTVEGLMIIPPFTDDPEGSRPYFKRLRELRDGAIEKGLLPESGAGLSMGMSGDFEVAIEEGATIVRIGTALFGPRQLVK